MYIKLSTCYDIHVYKVGNTIYIQYDRIEIQT